MNQQSDYFEERDAMIRDQIEVRGVRDPAVLDAMRSVPRHLFVPEPNRSRSYQDTPLPIGKGQTISQPYIVAIMTENLGVDKDTTALEIGTGSGYQAAVLGHICRRVITVEIIELLYLRARRVLSKLGYTNIECRLGDGNSGAADKAPFEAVLIAAAAPRFPETIASQLADGGTMVYPEGEPLGYQELIRVRKVHGRYERKRLMGVRFVPMTGAIRSLYR